MVLYNEIIKKNTLNWEDDFVEKNEKNILAGTRGVE